MSASRAWNISAAEFPANGSPREKLGYALKYATRAPREGHWQPWEFQLADDHVELTVRSDVASAQGELDLREPVIACGAALAYLKLALRRFNCFGRVGLFPDLDEPALLAKVYAGSGGLRDEEEAMLFEAMNRNGEGHSVSARPGIPEAALDAFSCVTAGRKAWLEFPQSEASRRRLCELSIHDPRHQSWNLNKPPVHETHGGPVMSGPAVGELVRGRLPRWARPLLAFAVRQEDEDQVTVQPVMENVPEVSALAVIKTKTDDKHGWLAAGQVLGRTILRAQTLGLSWSFFNHSVRRREGREKLRTSLGHKGYAQAVLRIDPPSATPYASPSMQSTVTATMQ